MCDVLFNVCKCTNHECRLFVASQLPVLLWTEWVLDRENPRLDEDRSAIEIALLAAFQQDLNIEASTPQIRIPDIKGESSIYHSKDAGSPFPMRSVPEKVIKPDPCMYPSRPVTKIDHYSRPIVFYRLCRLLQDNLPSLPCSTKVAYCLFIERMATTGTKLEDASVTECLQKLAMNLTAPYDAADNPSMLSLLHFDTKPKDHTLDKAEPGTPAQGVVSKINFDAIAALFDASRFTSAPKRFPASVPIYLLWADALTSFSFSLTNLSKIIQKQLLRRARYEGMPLVILALS